MPIFPILLFSTLSNSTCVKLPREKPSPVNSRHALGEVPVQWAGCLGLHSYDRYGVDLQAVETNLHAMQFVFNGMPIYPSSVSPMKNYTDITQYSISHGKQH